MLIPGDDGESETVPSNARTPQQSWPPPLLLPASAYEPEHGRVPEAQLGAGSRHRNCAGLLEVRREAERLVSLGARLQLLKGSAARAESPR